MRLAGDVGVYVGAVAATLFVAVYHLSARWWESAEGRHMMSFTAAMALILDYSGVRLLLAALPPVPPDVAVARAAVFDVVALLLVWRLELLWRLQIRDGIRRLVERSDEVPPGEADGSGTLGR